MGLDRFTDNLVCTLTPRTLPAQQVLTISVFLIELTWQRPEDDNLFGEGAQTMLTELDKYARSIDKDNQFIWLNYADKSQNPLRSYGSNNLRKLRRIARQYDPQEVFQYIVPGGFKLSAAGSA